MTLTRGGAREQLTIAGIPVDRSPAASRNKARWYGEGREWGTPPDLFGKLDEEFGFTLDPCALPSNAKCAHYFTEADNGLRQSWAGERVFMNPPYGRELRAWVHKARVESDRGALVVGLLPASTDQGWWHDEIVGRAEVRYIRGRVRFVMPDGKWANAWGAHVIVVWRPACPAAPKPPARPLRTPRPPAWIDGRDYLNVPDPLDTRAFDDAVDAKYPPRSTK